MTQTALLNTLSPELNSKAQALLARLSQMPGLVIAYSGGVDSGLLCAMAYQALESNMLAVTVHSVVEPHGDSEAASALARQVGFPHQIIEFDDLSDPDFVANAPDRCYTCKRNRFQALLRIAEATGARDLAEGSNADDAADYRPGARAVAELHIHSPLAEVGLTKPEIRALAHALGLSIWDRPSAPCLATRFPYGTPVTRQGLNQIAEGERYLQEKGFQQVRVRHYGRTARLEVAPEAIQDLVKIRKDVLLYFKNLGFAYVVADLSGYRSGSMNEVLTK